jgi:hypothetical protein
LPYLITPARWYVAAFSGPVQACGETLPSINPDYFYQDPLVLTVSSGKLELNSYV